MANKDKKIKLLRKKIKKLRFKLKELEAGAKKSTPRKAQGNVQAKRGKTVEKKKAPSLAAEKPATSAPTKETLSAVRISAAG